MKLPKKNFPLGWCSVSCCSDRDPWKPLSINASQRKDGIVEPYSHKQLPTESNCGAAASWQKTTLIRTSNSLFPQYYSMYKSSQIPHSSFNAVYFGGYWGMEQNEREKKNLGNSWCILCLWTVTKQWCKKDSTVQTDQLHPDKIVFKHLPQQLSSHALEFTWLLA